MDFAIGGIGIAALIIGIVEAAKDFGISGKGSKVLAMVLGFVFVGLAQIIANDMITVVAVQYIELVVIALAGSLAANGYYDLLKRMILKPG